jgi:hypothetical protein
MDVINNLAKINYSTREVQVMFKDEGVLELLVHEDLIEEFVRDLVKESACDFNYRKRFMTPAGLKRYYESELAAS